MTVLLLTAPAGFGPDFWNPLIPLLDSDIQVVVWDHRALGGSPSTTMDSLADAALAALDTVTTGPAHIVGLGWGGAFSLWLAQNRPERVQSLVLMSTAADTRATFPELVNRIALISSVFEAYRPFAPVLGMADHAEIARSKGMSAAADAVLKAALTPEYAAENTILVATLRDSLESCSAAAYAGLCEAAAAVDLLSGLRHIEVDTLVLAAASDWSVPPGTSRVVALGISRCTRIVVPGAAAFLIWPDAALIASHLLDHLRDHRVVLAEKG